MEFNSKERMLKVASTNSNFTSGKMDGEQAVPLVGLIIKDYVGFSDK